MFLFSYGVLVIDKTCLRSGREQSRFDSHRKKVMQLHVSPPSDNFEKINSILLKFILSA